MRLVLLALFLSVPALAQDVEFTSSNLPIVLIDTDGVAIPDEPKIAARMRIVDNGDGQRNAVTDAPNDYDGFIGIEIRGSSSQAFPKKQYGVETWDADGDDIDASLLGMPEEEDWVLYAPYSDKSLVRNVLAYDLARETGRYASRTRFCEVVLNGEYQGVYVLMEKIKRDDARVDINKLKDDEVEGDDLTGGYILELDLPDDGGWASPFPPRAPQTAAPFYNFNEPDADDIAPEQAAYIEEFVTAFEAVMDSDAYADPETGYPAWIDVGTFVDFVLVNELSHNVDAYRKSTYLHKDKDSNGGRLRAGPVWDFNLAFGNVNFNGGPRTDGFRAYSETANDTSVPFWWPKLLEDPAFRDSLATRWAGLRQGAFHPDSLAGRVGAWAGRLDEAQARNFERWPVLGTYVWPNPDGYEERDTYAEEVAFLQSWLRDRVAWLDEALGFETAAESAPGAGFSLSAWPNPARGTVRLALALGGPSDVAVDVFDVRGRRVAQLWDGPLADGAVLSLEAASLPAGVYLVRATAEGAVATRRVVVVR